MSDETCKVTFLILPYKSEGRTHAKVIPAFEGLRDRDHHRRVLNTIAVSCIRQLGLMQGLEAALEEVTALAYETRFEALLRVEYEDEREQDMTTDPDE